MIIVLDEKNIAPIEKIQELNQVLPTYAPMEEYGLGECYDPTCPSCNPEAYQAARAAEADRDNAELARLAKEKNRLTK